AVFYLPLDLPWVVSKVVGIIAPRVFVVVETEIWPNLFREMHHRNIPTVLVNGRISDRSAGRYKAASFFIGKVLKGVAAFGMQSQVDADRITAAGAEKERVQVTGNIKFDQPAAVMGKKEKESLRRELGLEEGERLILAGSTHEGEEAVVIDAFRRLKAFYPELVLLLAPRHPERLGRVEEVLREKNATFVRRTLAKGRQGEPVILLDTMGELGRLYALCAVAFVGGSLVNVGGHNLLEPAVWGKPVVFGPHMHNFREISEKLLSAGGGRQVASGEELERALEDLLVSGTKESMGVKGLKVVEENRGALQRTVEMVERMM
ncbi:MAG: 3-deoxy-D-manno-octulosonic acid transferase, partial [Nitrospirota bacterium]|nr:3-deoxy-D-manno-octulosonic acid transferase [Nitrospirota bacterium]